MKIIAGPCQIESRDHCLMMAEQLQGIALRLGVEILFKASFDKANRTSLHTERGVGIDAGLAVLDEVRRFGMKTITDIHEPGQARLCSGVVDILQVPALLCRQTDLLVAAGTSSAVVNLKRGQYVAAGAMRFAKEKVESGGAEVWLTERGFVFGYNDLVVDMRAIAEMKSFSDVVIFDCTHSVQTPGSRDGSSGGKREFIAPLANAAIAAGADGIFVETHNDPDNAPSDGDVMMPVQGLYDFLARTRDLHAFVSGR